MVICLMPQTVVASTTPSGNWIDVEKDDYYKSADTIPSTIDISTAEDLAKIARSIYNGKGEVSFESVTINLKNDIDLSARYWTPIGYYYDKDSSHSAHYSFKGTFDGNNHTIKGICCPTDKNYCGNYFGLFGNVEGAVIKNVKIDSTTIEGCTSAGSLVGIINSSNKRTEIVNCMSSASLDAVEGSTFTSSVGGIVGVIVDNADTTIRNCSFTGTIGGIGTFVGGIIGSTISVSNSGSITIDKCDAAGATIGSSTNGAYIGGIVAAMGSSSGKLEATIANCIADSSSSVGYAAVVGGSASTTNYYYKTENGKYTNGTTTCTLDEAKAAIAAAAETHTYGTVYSHNNTQHWKTCLDTTCSITGGEKSEVADHTWNNFKCSVCNYTPTKVNVPTAATGLKYTGTTLTGVSSGTGYTLTGNTGTNAGDYTATATLADGYIWNDSTTVAKNITWTIANAEQSAPTGLTAVKPSEQGASDGKITGVTTDMEWQKQGESTWTLCTGTEITGLAAGTYKVRYKAKTNYNVGTEASVTVPEVYSLTVTDGIGDGNYASGETVTITAKEPEAGKEFDKWIVVNGSATFNNESASTTTLTTTGENTVVKATYKDKQYTVIYNTDGGNVIGNKTVIWAGKVLEGISSPKKTGYVFKGWKYGETNVNADSTYSTLVANDAIATITIKADWNKCDHKASETKPTCTEPATCSICEELLSATGHTYTQEVVDARYLKSVANCKSLAVYYKSCVCGVFSDADDAATFENGSVNASNHIDENNDNKCDRCSKVLVTYSSNSSSAVTNRTEITETGTEKVTNADIASKTATDADGNKTINAVVDQNTGDKIVEKAVENKSEEVIVNTLSKENITGAAADATTEVAIPADTLTQISEKTDAALKIKTDAAEVTLSKEAVAAISDQAGKTDTVKLVVETVAEKNNLVKVNLKLETSDGQIRDFRGGNVTVTIKIGAELAKKNIQCVYIDDDGIYSKVTGHMNDDGTFTFETEHFSTYVIMEASEADAIINNQVAGSVAALSIRASSSKTSKGNTKVALSGSSDEIKAIKGLGYTVKYKFYRSTKKSSNYVAKVEKKVKSYINTAGKKGTRYYYKARIMVYDADGNLVAKSELGQCKYASRVWSK